MHIIKYPLLRRYVVDWRFSRTADFGAWEHVTIPSRSGALLAGLYGPARGTRHGVIVCAHPLKKSAKGFFLNSGRADALRRNGYDVLLFDFNGFGASSQGDFSYAQDIVAAADYAHERSCGLPVHALAVCFGSIWTLFAATQKQLFRAIIVESPFTSLHEFYARDRFARSFLRLLSRIFPKSAATADPIQSAGRLIGTPKLLVIGGCADRVAPIAMSRRLYEACNLPLTARSIWCVRDAEHLRAFETAPLEYEQRVDRFLTSSATNG